MNMMHCVKSGHEIVALANLRPKEKGLFCLTLYCLSIQSTGVTHISVLFFPFR